MMFIEYCMIENKAGGVSATPREMIRATRGMLSPERLTRAHRSSRHALLRDMLSMHHDATLEYMSVMSGRRLK